MKKWIIKNFGHTYYFLGTDSNGKNYFLEKAHFDCGGYWGFGYVETFTNNKQPHRARGIDSHQHFNSLFFNRKNNAFDNFKNFFKETPLTDKEIWTLCELMKTFYIMREYSDTLNRGGAHYTINPCAELIKNENEYKRINETVLPEIFNKIYDILGD